MSTPFVFAFVYNKIHVCSNQIKANLFTFYGTRPKPVEIGYVFSLAVGTIGKWLKLVPFFVRGRTVDSEGGGQFPGRQTP